MRKKKLIAAIITLVVGVGALVAGLVFMLIQFNTEPGLRDAEYLVEVGEWIREDAPSVIWDFAEVGKGTLTTNAHTNDYDFIWALDGEAMKVETEWLYTLNDEYIYTIDQTESKLTLTSGDEVITFVASGSE